MSINKLGGYILIVLLFVSCKQKVVNKYEQLSSIQQDSIAERFNEIANIFWQPTEGYRRYKDSAILVAPEHIGYRQTLSYAYKKRGEHIQAMETLNEAVRMDIANGSHAALEYRAWTYLYYYRDYTRAIQDIDKITEMSGTTFNVCWGEDCMFQKGQALYRLGKMEQAIQAFNLSLTDMENNGLDIKDEIYTYFYLGRCHQELGQWSEAIAQYDRALGSYPNFSECIFQKSKIFRQTGHAKAAEETLDKAAYLLANNYKMGEPYFERFDELFPHMIKEERALQFIDVKN